MRRRLDTCRRRALIAGALLAVHLVLPRVAVAQDVTVPALKAAFIYNFVKFTEWPAGVPLSEPFVLCVIGDAAVGNALGRLVEGRAVAGRPIVTLSATTRPTRTCGVLYVSGATVAEATRAIAGLQDSPVLTMSDLAGFTDSGGMAQFFFAGGQLRFTIKADAVRRSGLKMSSRLLTLGQR